MAYREIKVQDVSISNQLNKNITVAPLHQSYALCIEYMKHWFLEKFEKDFFSWIHIDGSHVFGEISKIDKKTTMSHLSDDKAALSIIPMIDDDYKIIEKLSTNGVKTLYFRDTNLKRLAENDYVKEVNNWGDVCRYFSSLENK